MIKATILVEELNNKKYDELLNDIYVDTNLSLKLLLGPLQY